jgi:hypothetical protein
MNEEQVEEIEILREIIEAQKRSILEHEELLKRQERKLEAKLSGFQDLYRAHAEQDDVPDHLMDGPAESIIN